MSTSNRWSKGDIISRGLAIFLATIFSNFLLVVYFNLDQHVPFWILCVMTLIWGLMGTYMSILGNRWHDRNVQQHQHLSSQPSSSSPAPPYSDSRDKLSGYEGWIPPEDRPAFNPPPTDNEEDEDDDTWEAPT